jgi:exodeoxyribonuclease III
MRRASTRARAIIRLPCPTHVAPLNLRTNSKQTASVFSLSCAELSSRQISTSHRHVRLRTTNSSTTSPALGFCFIKVTNIFSVQSNSRCTPFASVTQNEKRRTNKPVCWFTTSTTTGDKGRRRRASGSNAGKIESGLESTKLTASASPNVQVATDSKEGPKMTVSVAWAREETKSSLEKEKNKVVPPLPKEDPVRLVSWNINGMSAMAEKGHLASYVDQYRPHLICLQETRISPAKLPTTRARLLPTPTPPPTSPTSAPTSLPPNKVYDYPFEYHLCSTRRLGYAGVGIYSQFQPIGVRYGLGLEEHDAEARCITLEFPGVYLVTSYHPNSGDGLKRLSYRRQWNADFEAFLLQLSPARAKPLIICGDFNVARHDIDLYDPDGNHTSAGFTPQEREDFERLLAACNLADPFRLANPGPGHYTWWSYRSGARRLNIGWRIDYFLVSKALLPFVKSACIHGHVPGSDHCPIELLVDPSLFLPPTT